MDSDTSAIIKSCVGYDSGLAEDIAKAITVMKMMDQVPLGEGQTTKIMKKTEKYQDEDGSIKGKLTIKYFHQTS
eukprot:CAMPEP_0168337926 /NCGR_PEP_ID=MMETSP0213-20121227/12501_1 /TAXON_ID=151035 /ORGANISM="Euplotes harpa, Strain FSP1.4" /LENGTH=73 /DNA_ID=CAMNT_0008343549 /DNA_START=20 /DNA_END=241 /DNA_ORIENTATION=+